MHGRTEPIDDHGRHRPTAGRRAPYPPTTGASVATGRHRARHRGPRRALAGPLALGAVVTVLLVMLGVGAAMLPVNLTGGNDRGTAAPPPQGPAVDATDQVLEAEASAEPSATASPSGTASPSPSRTRASRAPTPARKTTQPASRATRRDTTTTSSSGGSADSREAQVVAIVNRERAAAGCGALVVNSQLATAARRHSQDQAANNTMSHTGSDGSSFVERARRAGYQNPVGENVAMGYRTPEAVMEGWMNSDGHRRNILNCQARAIGVGVAAASDGSLYWTQVFGATA